MIPFLLFETSMPRSSCFQVLSSDKLAYYHQGNRQVHGLLDIAFGNELMRFQVVVRLEPVHATNMLSS